MKLSEQIGAITKELEQKQKPINKDQCMALYKYTTEIRFNTALYNVFEIIKEVQNVESMMSRYLPKNNFYDSYGNGGKSDMTWHYNNMERERLKLIKVLRKLKSVLEEIQKEEVISSHTPDQLQSETDKNQ